MTAIRAAAPADVAALLDLDRRCFGRQAWSRVAWAAELAAAGPSRRTLVVLVDDVLVGCAVVLVTGDSADLLRIAVSAPLRRGGLGSTLLEAVLDQVARAGCRQILLEVDAANAGAVAFYESHGFAPIDRRPAYYPDGADALVMRRPVAPARPAAPQPTPESGSA